MKIQATKKRGGATFTTRTQRARPRRRGLVLLLVLVAIVLLSLAAYTFAHWMTAELAAASARGDQGQVELLVDSGASLIRSVLTEGAGGRPPSGDLADNPAVFRGVLVRDDADSRLRGRFTVLAAHPASEFVTSGSVRYGLSNESARFNLGHLAAQETAGREMLLKLPGMTEDVADAILDWVDADDMPRIGGAESDVYQQRQPPYAAKNGPLDAIDELLLVQGVGHSQLFGIDANQNGLVDAAEVQRGGPSSPQEDPLLAGWSAYLTLFSAERNVNASGSKRIHVNANDLQQLHADLVAAFDQKTADFIVAFRQSDKQDGQAANGNGTAPAPTANPTQPGTPGTPPPGAGPPTGVNRAASDSGNPSRSDGGAQGRTTAADGGRGSAGQGKLDLSQPAKQTLASLLDLIGATAQAQYDGGNGPVPMESPFANEPEAMAEYLPKLMDLCTVQEADVIPGRVNINVASRAVLETLPGMEPAMIDRILEDRATDRQDPADSQGLSATWLLTKGIVTLEQMKALDPWVTTGGDVYRAQIVGFLEGEPGYSRAEIVVDATSQPARMISWKELTHLGRGFSRDVLNATADSP